MVVDAGYQASKFPVKARARHRAGIPISPILWAIAQYIQSY